MAATLRDERARVRALLREQSSAAASPPTRAPAPPTNPRVVVDLTGWHAVPASRAAQFYIERDALASARPGFGGRPS
tara:strand:+ start:1920 stop:2150 length:231 start_codon:yes stop_codon:yes gene_type:complete